MNTAPASTENVFITDDPALIDVPFVHHFLSTQSYWAQNIPYHLVARSIQNSMCFGAYLGGKQIGFARVVTDTATFAYLADVFIIPEHRGKGYSKQLMAFIHAHPGLQGLRRWMLGTRDAHGLYNQFGWTPLSSPERFMHLHKPDIYKPI